MRYMLMICEKEQDWAAMTADEQGAELAKYGALIAELAANGNWVGGAQLEPTTTATTVRLVNGAVQATDGPFAETREQIGGYFLIEAKDIDEAIAIAARIPAARNGSIEVRPVVPNPGASAATDAVSAAGTA